MRRLVAVAAGSIMVTACGAGASGPTLEPAVPVGNKIKVTAPPEARSVWVTTLGQFCLSGPGEATITSVELEGVSGVAVDAFGADNGEVSYLLGNPGTMDDLDAGTDKIITVTCQPDVTPESQAAINMQVSLTGDQDGSFDSVVIHWDTGDRQGTIETPLAMELQAA